MLTLALDTSSESGSVAIMRDDRLIGVVSTNTEEIYSSRIFRQLDFLLSELSLALDRFDLFAVNAGPGSFTGLRVGLTLAKAWAEVYRRPIAPVGGLEAVAAQCAAGTSDALIVPALDARRGQIYAGSYWRQGHGGIVSNVVSRVVREAEDVVITPQEFLVLVGALPRRADTIIVATPSTDWLKGLLDRAGGAGLSLPVEQVSGVLAPIIGSLGYQKFARGETVDALQLDANYVRRSDAELHWKGK